MNKIKELEQKVKELQEEIEKLKSEKKTGKWKPEVGEGYWFLTSGGEISVCYYWTNDRDDILRYNHIRLFKTIEECKQYKKFIEDVNKHKYEFIDDEWESPGFKKYYIYYSRTENRFIVDYNCSATVAGAIYFKTREETQYIIDNYKEELLKGWL